MELNEIIMELNEINDVSLLEPNVEYIADDIANGGIWVVIGFNREKGLAAAIKGLPGFTDETYHEVPLSHLSGFVAVGKMPDIVIGWRNDALGPDWE